MSRLLVVTLTGAAILGGLSLGNAASLSLTSGRLTPFQTCVLTATPNPTATVADAHVDEATPAVNVGTLPVMSTQPGGTHAYDQRIYVRFDLSACSPAIPVTAAVRLATLRLNVASFPMPSCETEDVFAATAAWTETTVTWANQPAGTTYDLPASASRTASADVGGKAGCSNGTLAAYVPWDVSADVTKWVAGTAVNRGWMIRHDIESVGNKTDQVVFIAKESGLPSRAPQLIITYVP